MKERTHTTAVMLGQEKISGATTTDTQPNRILEIPLVPDHFLFPILSAADLNECLTKCYWKITMASFSCHRLSSKMFFTCRSVFKVTHLGGEAELETLCHLLQILHTICYITIFTMYVVILLAFFFKL